MKPNDADNPKSWSSTYRCTFASSAPTGIMPQLVEQFGFGDEVAKLPISLFVSGYCVRPLVWGPLSEQFDRKPIFIGSFFVYTCSQVGSALAPNTAAILMFRLLGGTFSGAPPANSGAVMSDIWDVDVRGMALSFFALAPFAGSALGPMVSGFMGVAGLSWRWVFWLSTFFTGGCLMLIVFTLPETYEPVLLVQRAQMLRKETGDPRYWAPLEKQAIALAPPGRLRSMKRRLSFIYGVMYLLFEAYPIVFTEGHGFNAGISGLMFLPIFIGASPRYVELVREFAPNPVPPEYRTEPCMAPLIAGLPMGFAIESLFMGLLTYTIDSYLFVAASALSALTIVRSFFGAGFPLLATQMYEKLNPRWATTLLGCIAVMMAPTPFVLRAYGRKLRKSNKFAPTGDLPNEPSQMEGRKTSQETV
ncbi:MFS general substrate transporter [Trametes punicea]|nr:MFS general substrate transporter [Trametes punicea]